MSNTITIIGFRVRNFKSIKDVSIGFCGNQQESLSSITALIGRNQAGKSNLVDAFNFVVEHVAIGLHFSCLERGGLKKILFFEQKRSVLFELYYKHNNNIFVYKLQINADNAFDPFVHTERIDKLSNSDQSDSLTLNAFYGILRKTFDLSKKTATTDITDVVEYLNLYHRSDFERFLNSLSLDIPSSTEGYTTGVQKIIYVFYTLKLQQAICAPLIIFEELENSLHHGAVEKLIHEIRSVAEKNKTLVLVTTHSPTLLNIFSPDEVWIITKSKTSKHSSLQRVDSMINVNNITDEELAIGNK